MNKHTWNCNQKRVEYVQKKLQTKNRTDRWRILQNFFLELNLKENNYVCKFCVNKLNRLVRIGDDIRNKLETLLEKRNELLNELKRTVASKTQLRTPVNRKRERQKNTPTPRKPKVRRLLPFHNSPRAREPVLFKPRTERTSEEATELWWTGSAYK